MKTVKTLKRIFFITITANIIMTLLFETDLLESGLFISANAKRAEFIVHILMVLIPLCSVVMALRLIKWNYIIEKLRKNTNSMLSFGITRLTMLCLPLTLNTLCYYLFLNTSFAYLAGIAFLAMMFIYPSKSRCEEESKLFEGEEA